MTRDEATRLVQYAKNPLCGRIVYDASGATLFADPPSSLAKLVQISAIGLSIFTAHAQPVQSSINTSLNERCSTKVTVFDPTGAAVPGARIILAQIGRVEMNNSATDPNGIFHANLRPGQYTLRVEAPGFAPYVNQRLILACMSDKRPNDVSVTLNVGWVGEVVEVKHYNPLRRLWIGLKSLIARL